MWRGVPKGWGTATSTTWKNFWTTDGVGAKVGFNLLTASGTEGDLIWPYPGIVPSCGSGCSASTQKDPLGTTKMNVTTITLPNLAIDGYAGRIVEGGLFHIYLDRGDNLWTGSTYVSNGLYQGKVYVFGMSVVANF
jgi:hypothetical protein